MSNNRRKLYEVNFNQIYEKHKSLPYVWSTKKTNPFNLLSITKISANEVKALTATCWSMVYYRLKKLITGLTNNPMFILNMSKFIL